MYFDIKIINNFFFFFEKIIYCPRNLKVALKILVGQEVFKLWNKTVKILFWQNWRPNSSCAKYMQGNSNYVIETKPNQFLYHSAHLSFKRGELTCSPTDFSHTVTQNWSTLFSLQLPSCRYQVLVVGFFRADHRGFSIDSIEWYNPYLQSLH